MKWIILAAQLCACAASLHAETAQERGKRVVNDCLNALGGEQFLHMENRVESGRAYSFYRERLSGLTVAKLYTHYDAAPKDSAHELAIRQRQNFGKNEDYGVLFGSKEGWEITFRGARPLADDRFASYKETTLRDIFYILRVRLQEPGLIFESKGSDVVENSPVDIVDVIDADNQVTTVYFHQQTKLPTRQVFYRRDPQTKDRIEEITRYSKYRDVGGGVQWPYAIERSRDGEKIYQMFSESVQVNNNKMSDDLFVLPSTIKLLKP